MATLRLQPRQKELLLKALELLEKRAESLKQGIEELGYSTMVLDVPLWHIMSAKSHLMKSQDGTIALATPGMADAFRIIARDALAYNLTKLSKIEKSQTDCLVPTEDTRETMQEVTDLRELFSDQYSLAGELERRLNEEGHDATVTVSSGGVKREYRRPPLKESSHLSGSPPAP